MPSDSSSTRGLVRLNGHDARVLLLWLLAALVGAGVAYRYFFRAFPEAAVNFKMPRGAALDRAREFAMAQGAQLAGYQSTIVFGVDDDEKTYLEREISLERANQLMASEVNVWYWDVRFFKPLQREQFRVRVSPGGAIVGYEHTVEEAAAGARLDRDAAQARATAFLQDALHVPLGAYTFLPEEANSETRPNRTDWSFTWERTGFKAKDAPYRLNVQLEGDQPDGYAEYLKIPDSWERDFRRLRSSNEFIELIALIPYALLFGAALSVVVMLGRRGTSGWGWGLWLGLFIAALYFVMQLNSWPAIRAGYDTNASYSSFVFMEIVKALAGSLALSLLVVLAVVPGEPLYRAGQPDRLRLGSALTLQGMRTKEFFVAGVVGVCLAAAHIGYVVTFYVAGRRFGVWAPQDLQYSDTLSTTLPWIGALTIGIYAAASEEFLFRLFSVHFLLRSQKSKFLAVVLPAFAWGFLHSNYPQEPGYIRGLEVGLIGIVAGLVMLRWGILATLTWHYTVDAFLTALSLLRSDDLYSRISGGIVGFGALIPIGIAGAFYLARGGFVDATPLLNRSAPLAEAPVAVEAASPSPHSRTVYTPMAARALGGLALCGAIGVLLVWAVKPNRAGTFVQFSVDARQAEERADELLQRQKVNPGGYRRTATIQYTFDPVAIEYLRREMGIEEINRIYRDQVPSAFWTVRYFRDSQKEEYLVVLHPDGSPYSVHHTVAEANPGASLDQQDALARASAYLSGVKGLNLAQWKLVAAESDKLPARTDHTFVWEQTAALDRSPADGEGAHVRVQVQVQGDEISAYRTFIHLPEEWVRKHSQTTLAESTRGVAFGLAAAAFVIAVLVIFFRNLRQPEVAAVPWRRLAGWAIVALVAAVVSFAAVQPQYLASYRTDVPFHTYFATVVISLSLSTALAYSGTVLLFGLAWFFLARTYGGERLPGWRGMPAAYYRDALVGGMSGAAILFGVQRLGGLLTRRWPVARFSFPESVPQGLDANWPALHTLAGGVTYSFIAVGVLALAVGFASWYLRPAWMQWLILAAIAILIAPRPGGGADLLESALIDLALFSVIWWGAKGFIRFNLLGYFLAAMLLALAPSAGDLLGQPNSHFRANGWTVVAMIAALLLWPLVAWLRGGGAEDRADGQVSPG